MSLINSLLIFFEIMSQEVSTVVKQSLPKKEPSTIKETHSTASSEFTSPSPSSICYIKSKDARSALERAKTEECRKKIRNITCLAQAGKLYDTGIKNSCPIGRNPAKQFQHVPYEKGKGPLPRIAFLLSVHGRAVRQLQRLFKTIYQSDHFYIIHVDVVSHYNNLLFALCNECYFLFRDQTIFIVRL